MRFSRTLRCAAPALFLGLAWGQDPRPPSVLQLMLAKVAEQVEAFRQIAPTVYADETLEQRTPSGGSPVTYNTHQVISVYGFQRFPETSRAIHEIRKVVSVDGKQVTSQAKAREALTLGMTSADDQLKKKLLEDFEKNGLRGAVTDSGQLILLFSAQHQKDYEFEQAGAKAAGNEFGVVLKYKQVGGSGAVTVFQGKGEVKQALEGQLVVRPTDGSLLEITMITTRPSQNGDLTESLEVDYTDSGWGCLLPVRVSHRESLNGSVVIENLFRYGTFHRLGESGR